MFKKLFLSIIIVCFMLTPAQALNKPKIPTNVKASSLNSSQIKITWTKAKDADYYIVYRSTGGAYKQIVKTKSSTYTNSGLIGNTKYWYKVKAGNKAGLSSSSSVVYTTSLKDNTRPSAPTGIGIYTNEDEYNSFDVTWDENIEPDIKGYYVYKSSDLNSEFTRLEFDDGKILTPYSNFTYYHLREDDVYYFYITAVDTSGNESLESRVFYLSLLEPIYEINDVTNKDGTLGKQVIFTDDLSLTIGQVINIEYEERKGDKENTKAAWFTMKNQSDQTIYFDQEYTTIAGIDDLTGKYIYPDAYIYDDALVELEFVLPTSLSPGEFRSGYLYFDTNLNLTKLYFKDNLHKAIIDIPK